MGLALRAFLSLWKGFRRVKQTEPRGPWQEAMTSPALYAGNT